MVGDDNEAKPLLTSSDLSANSLLLSPTSPKLGHALSCAGPASQNGGRAPLLATGPAFLKGSPAPFADGNGTASRVMGSFPVHGGNAPGENEPEAYYQKVSDSPSPQNGVLETAIESAPGVADSQGTEDTKSRAPDTNDAMQIPLIRFCGLTQSDSSMSSVDGGRGYGYGTQTEYTPPDLSYFPSLEYINGLNSSYRALHLLHSPSPVFFIPHNSHPFDATSVGDCGLSPSKTSPALGKHSVPEDTAPAEIDTNSLKKESAVSESACEKPTGCESGFSNVPATRSPAATVAGDSEQNAMISGTSSPKTDCVGMSEGSHAPVRDSSLCVSANDDSANQTLLNHDKGDVFAKACGTEAESGDEPSHTMNACKPGNCDCSSEPKTGGDVPVKGRPSSCSVNEKIQPSSHSDVLSSAAAADPSEPTPSDAHLHDTSDQPQTLSQSPDPSVGQSNASAQSCDVIIDQQTLRGSDGVGQAQNRANSTPSTAPETTVVMKKLLSLDDERTTFL